MRGIEWLKSQCNRYKNGQCTTLKCLKDGGFRGFKQTKDEETVRELSRKQEIAFQKAIDCATCEPHEILMELENLKDEIKGLESDIYNLEDSI